MKKLFITALLFAMCSCSTMFNNDSQTVLVSPSNVSDEGVTADISTPSVNYRATLPASVVASPSTFSHVKVKINQSCYEPTKMQVDEDIALSYWMNIFNGVGFVIDFLDGYMWKYDSQAMVKTTKIPDCEKSLPKK